jgi:hypothetical protein
MVAKNFPYLISALFQIYKKYECKIVGGYPSHFTAGNSYNLFNYVVKKNKILSTSASISNDELFTLFNLSFYLKPKNIFIIGNSYGISAVFLSLLFPKSIIVAIDKYRTKVIKFTNKLLSKTNNLKIAVQGDSPKDVKNIINKYFKNKKLDLVLIDGLHTNKALINDYESVMPFLSSLSVVIFHDVINCKMMESFFYLKAKYKFNGYLLTKTSSGMGIAFKSKVINSSLLDYLNYSSDSLETVLKVGKINKKKSEVLIDNKFVKHSTKFIIPKHPQK